MKIVINKCFGGFGLSNLAVKRYLELCGKECHFYDQLYKGYDINIKREYVRVNINPDNICSFLSISIKDLGDRVDEIPDEFDFSVSSYRDELRANVNLIKVIEELGELANGRYSKLKIVEIPDNVDWEIDEYDGIESIHEKHRVWE